MRYIGGKKMRRIPLKREWNSDRTVIWLTSDNISDFKLYIIDDKM